MSFSSRLKEKREQGGTVNENTERNVGNDGGKPVNAFLERRSARERDNSVLRTPQRTPAQTDLLRADRNLANEMAKGKQIQKSLPYPHLTAIDPKEERKRERNKQKSEEMFDRAGFRAGDSFMMYDKLGSQPDYDAMVEKGKAKINLFHTNDATTTDGWKDYFVDPFKPERIKEVTDNLDINSDGIHGPLDYLNKDKRAILQGSHYNFTRMTDREKDLYFYLNGKYDAQTASNYIKSINKELNARNAESVQENTAALSKEHPAIGAALDAGVALGGSGAYPVLLARQAYRKATGSYKDLDPNDPLFGTAIISGATREGISDNETFKNIVPNQGLRNFLAGTGLSMTENLARLPMGYMGLGAAAGAAGLSGTRGAVQRGAGTNQAIGLGISNAAAEAFFEKFSLEGLKSLKVSPGRGVREFLKNIGKQALTEGSEEIFTEVSNTLTDQAIMGELSQYNLNLQQYRSNGLDEEEAKKKALEDVINNIVLAGAGGALSGGIMGGSSQALGLINESNALNQYGKGIDQDYREFSQGIDTSRESYKTEADHQRAVDLQRLAQEYADKQANKEFIPNRDKARYERDLLNFNSDLQAGEIESYINEGMTEDEAWKRVYDSVRGEAYEGEGEWAGQQAEGKSQESVVQPPEEGYNRPERPQEEQTTPTGPIADHVSHGIAETGQEASGGLEDGLGANPAEAYRKPYGKNGQAAMMGSYDGMVDIPAYNKAFGRAYDAGYHGIDMDIANRSAIMSVLDGDQFAAAYRAGAQDFNVDNNIDLKTGKPKNMAQGPQKEGGQGKVAEAATEAQRTVAEHVGKMTGLKINLVDGMEQSGAVGSYKDGEITLSVNSSDFNGSLTHELTHHIKAYSPKGYKLYSDTVIERLMQSQGKSFENIMEDYENRYSQAGQELTREQIREEVVADATQKFFNDPEFINAIKKKDRTVAQRISDFLSDVIDAIKTLVKTGSTRAAAKGLEEDLKYYEDARDAWMLALEDAAETYKSGMEVQKEGKGNQKERNALERPSQATERHIEENYDKVRKMEAVKKLSGNEFEKGEKDLVTQVSDFYRSIGGKVHNDVVGDIFLDRDSVKDDVSHGIGRAKAITFAAVPDILRDGYVLDHKKNWKNRGYDSAVIGAKIKVAEGKYAGEYYGMAVVKVMDDNKMYLHEVHAIKAEDAVPFKTPDLEGGKTRSDTRNPPPIYSIFDKLRNVKEANGGGERFQLKETVEETKDLIAVHNLSEEKLLGNFELGGIPMPSIAITKADIGHSNFGDISIVFKKDTIDPKNRKNKVYGADAWTPTFPRIEYEADEKAARAAADIVNQLSEDLPDEYAGRAKSFVSGVESNLDNYGGKAGLIDRALNDYGMKAAYLASEGESVEVSIKKSEETLSKSSQTLYEALLDEFKDEIEQMKGTGREVYEKYGDRIKNAYYKGLVEIGESEGMAWDKVGRMNKFAIVQEMRNALKYRDTGPTTKTEKPDYASAKKSMDSRISESQYKNWLDNLFEGVEKRRGIHNGKDYFTQSGNRRSFGQLHFDVTVENVVKAMLAQRDDARSVSGWQGIKSIRAVVADEFKNIDQIKEKSGRLIDIDTESYNKKLESLEGKMYATMRQIADGNASKMGNSFMDIDNIGECILEACKNPTVQNIQSVLGKHDWKITTKQAGELADVAKSVYDMPVNMFEAKPQRVVDFDEIAAAVIPTTASESLKAELEANGINTVVYDPNLPNARYEAVNNLEDVKFQLEDVDEDASNKKIESLLHENQSLRDANDLMKEQFKLTPKSAVRMQDVERVAKGLLKEYNSTYKGETLIKNLDKLYEYIRGAENIDGSDLTEAAASIAKSVLKQSQQLDTELTEQYKDLRDQIKNTKITLSDQDKAGLASEGGYNTFRKRNFGRIRLGKDGIGVDSLYQELSEQHPELFPEAITHPADQLVAIEDALNQTEAQVRNPYNANMDEMSYMVGQDILQSYFDVRAEKPTFADRKQSEIQRVKKEYSKKMRDYKDGLKKEYERNLGQVKKESLQKVQDLARAYRNLTDAGQREQQEYYKGKMDDLRNEKNQRLAATQQRGREQVQKIRDRQKAQEAKKAIIKESKAMQNWLLKPTDAKHVPQSLRGAVADFLSNIDFSSNNDGEILAKRTEAWNRAKEEFENIIKNEGIFEKDDGSTLYMEIDPDLVYRVMDIMKKTKGIDKLDNLDAYTMGELKKTVLSMKKAITEANSLLSNKKSGELNVLAEGVFKDLKDRKNRTEYAGMFVGKADKMLNYDMLDPQTMFGQMGENMKSTYDTLRDGLDRKTVKLRIAQKHIQELMEQNNISYKDLRQWSGADAKPIRFQTSGGTVELTVSQVMSLYELNKRTQAKLHMYDHAGGIRPAPRMGKLRIEDGRIILPQIEKAYQRIGITEADLQQITSRLTPEQKALADGMQRFMGDECAKWGNEVSMMMYGYEKFTAGNYFPIVTDDNYIRTRQGGLKGAKASIKNMGFTKSTVMKANKPIIIEDIFDVYSRQVDQMSTYHAYVVPLSDLNKVFNYIDMRGEMQGGSIKQEIERAFGKAGNEYINKLVEDVNGSLNSDKSIGDQLLSNMKAASIAGNLRVAIQQPTSYVRAAMEISPKYLVKGAATMTKRGQWDLICEYAPIAQWKDWGFYRMDTSRQMKDVMFNTDSRRQRFVNKTMFLAEAGDKLAWNRLWRACEFECRDTHPELKEGTEDYYKEVGRRFGEIIDKTQVVDSVLHRTQIMRSEKGMDKIATNFMAESLKSYNMLYRAQVDLKAGVTGAKTRAARAGAVFVADALATSVAAAVMDAMRDGDRDKKWLEKYGKAVWENFKDNVNLLNNIPYVRDAYGVMIDGYSPNRPDVAAYQDMYHTMKQLEKLRKGTNDLTPQATIIDAVISCSKFLGSPAKSMTRDAHALLDSAINGMGSKSADYAWLKQTYNMGSEKNLELYAGMMIEANRSGNKDLEKHIKMDLNKAGIENDDISGKIKTLIKGELISKKSVNPLVDEAAQAKAEMDLDTYESDVNALMQEGYAGKLIGAAIESRMNQLKTGEETDWEAEAATDPDDLYGEILTGKESVDDWELYSLEDILEAVKMFENTPESLKAFNRMAQAIVEGKVKSGRTKEEAARSIKTSISKKYKADWIAAYKAGNRAEYEAIQKKLIWLKVNGKPLYDGYDLTRWVKEAGKK